MNAPKRFAASESAPGSNDVTFRNRRILAGSTFDVHRAEPSQQQSTVTMQLDMQRAESSRQHVRALNTQFASWVQTQLKNHPDELWEDGIRDYLVHASNIMEKFSDVVDWLKANATKGVSAPESLTSEKKSVPETKNSENKLTQEKSAFAPSNTNGSFTTSWSSSVLSNNESSEGIFSNNQSPGGVFPSSQGSVTSSKSPSSGLFSNSQSSGAVFSNSQSPVLFSNSQSSGLFSNSQSSGGLFSNNQTSGVFSNIQSSGLFSKSQSSGLLFNSQSSLFSNSQSSGIFSPNQNTGVFSNSQSSGVFGNTQTPVLFGGQSSAPTNHNTLEDAENEEELPQPGSPSVKKSEEKGVVVVHEVKCKLYVKSSDPEDKDAWKDKGTGQLSIKCKEGISKGTKESKPTIIVRNDVGKVLLNALLYPGIKTNLQKNSLVAIFHTSGDGDNGESVVARTFLIRTKTEEDRNQLASAIQECAPAS